MKQGLTVEEAQRRVLALTPVLDSETLTVAQALGRVLVEPVVSSRRIPPADCSAMDGYAVRVADLLGAVPARPVDLAVKYEVAAGGQAVRTLEAGEAARIFTGAPVPPGADAVVRQEDVAVEGDRVRIGLAPPLRDNIRQAGEDLEVGDRVLEAGAVVRPSEIGLLASLGRSVVAVHRRPRVAILSGGDELVEPDRDVAGGRIVSSNSYTLAAQCHQVGADPLYLGIARDRRESVEAHFRAGLAADCIVSSAGVSVGDHDHVRPVLEKLGCQLDFWGVLMKPGFPIAFGRFGSALGATGMPGPLVFGLPGNPVSASVTFDQFVRPALLKMMGHTACFRPTVRARLGEKLTKKPGRLHFVRVTLERIGDEFVAASTGSQSSGVMRSMSLAHGLLIFPLEASELSEGDEAVVQVLDDGFFAGTTPGF